MDTESTPESADEVSSISSTTDGLYYVALIIVAAVILCAVTILLLYYSRKRRSTQVHADLTDNKNETFHGLILKKWDGQVDRFEENTECDLCSKPFQAEEDICVSRNKKCQHVHHTDCLRNWLHLQNTCPTCNMPFVVESV